MAETTGRQIVYSALILTAVLSGIFILIANFIPEGASNNENFGIWNESMQRFSDIKNNSDSVRTQIIETNVDSGPLGIVNGLIQNIWGTFKVFGSSLTIIGDVVAEMGDIFGLPGWFISLLIAMIGTGVAFAIAAAAFKWYV